MGYDKMLKIFRSEPELKPYFQIIRDARVFEYQYYQEDTQTITKKLVETDVDNLFCLPFDKICMVQTELPTSAMTANICIIWDDDGQIGLDKNRNYIMYGESHGFSHIYIYNGRFYKDDGMLKWKLNSCHVYVYGKINEDGLEWEVEKVSKRLYKTYINDSLIEKYSRSLALDTSMVVYTVARMLKPDHMIIQERPVNPRRGGNPYSYSNRPKYTMLKIGEVKKRYATGQRNADGQKMMPHIRRRHLRRYPNDAVRYPNAHGKVKVIEPVYINLNDTVTINKTIYKVMINH
jgi:hypothetical protein